MQDRIVYVLAPLAGWILLNGIDDLFMDAVFCWRALRKLLLYSYFHWPSGEELDRVQQRRIAIFVPLWHEHQVIRKMLEHNLSAVRYENYDFFVGAYPNDLPTVAAIRDVASRHSRVHLAVVPHDGPTSKADCLNAIYQHMREFEQEHGARFEVLMTHDAEDLIHPESLRLINFFSRTNDMVQVPVLALPTPLGEFTHGLYCDEFAEFQVKDIPVRQFLRGFLPSNGVGTGFSRVALEKLAESHEGQLFEPGCLTEDYENGYRIHAQGGRQVFLPVRRVNGSFIATREYFPRHFRAAVKQRSRWTMGIGLQAWERHGWRAAPGQLYWFWRDRKALVGNLVAPLANLFFLYGALAWLPGARHWRPSIPAESGALRAVFFFTLGCSVLHLLFRAGCVGWIYGVRFALGVPLRTIFGNWLNCLATVQALGKFAVAKLRKRQLTWAKTEHAYPSHAGLMEHRRRIGEILVASGEVDSSLLESALGKKPVGERLGEYLMRMGLLSADALYHGLSQQQNLPRGLPAEAPVVPRTTRNLPAWVSKKWKVLPFRVVEGELFLAGSEVPSDGMTQEISRFSKLGLRFHLVTPTEFESLARAYLP